MQTVHANVQRSTNKDPPKPRTRRSKGKVVGAREQPHERGDALIDRTRLVQLKFAVDAGIFHNVTCEFTMSRGVARRQRARLHRSLLAEGAKL